MYHNKTDLSSPLENFSSEFLFREAPDSYEFLRQLFVAV